MRPALEWEREGDRFRLSGRIDEYSDLATLAVELPAEVTLDLSGLTRINSIGVREWMDFVANFGDRTVRLERCAPVFVDQLNAIANFSGNAHIHSVLCEYECEVDAAVTLVEVEVADARAGRFSTAPRCPRCGATMLAAGDDESYYRFVRYMR